MDVGNTKYCKSLSKNLMQIFTDIKDIKGMSSLTEILKSFRKNQYLDAPGCYFYLPVF